MTPGNYNLTIYRGDSYRWQFKLWSDPAKTQPVDLNGVIVKAEIRDRSAGKLLATLACAVELPNIINVALDAATSHAMPAKGVWDLQLTYPSTDVATVLAGAVSVTDDVTDSTTGTGTGSAVGMTYR
jgi:hypothetical protein